MKLMRVTAVDCETNDSDDEVFIQLTGRDEYGERVRLIVEDTLPYFYVKKDYNADWPTEVVNIRYQEKGVGYESFDGTPLKRIYTKTPADTKALVKGIDETWESDIPYYRRATIDYGLSGYIRVPEKSRCSIDEIETDPEVGSDDHIEPRVFIADIEVLQKTVISFDAMKKRAEAPISHITVWDSLEDEYIVLHLDPDDRVDPGEVSSLLDGHSAAESLRREMERDIRLRSFESESELLSGFIRLFENRRPDLVSGWNFIDFDWDYLLKRFEKHANLNEHALSDIGYINGYQVERKVDCVPAFDMMDAYCEKMTFSNWRSKRLDYVSKEKLGIGKIPNVNVYWSFENARDELVSYNIMDVMLCVALDRIEGIHDFFYELAELSQIQIYDTFSEMRLVDGYIMARATPEEILPPQEEKDIPENAGGLVLNPSDGVRDWIGVHDVKSLYPSAIITFNISTETIILEEETTNGPPRTPGGIISIPWLPDSDHAEGGNFGLDEIRFDRMWADMTNEGLIPKYLKRLFPEREKRKEMRNQYDPDDELYDVWDRKQAAVKVIMNSFYGVMSNDYWRLGKFGLGDAVTSAARFVLWMGKEIAEDEGIEVYYGDTDSIMVELAQPDESKEIALQRGRELEETLNERMVECVEMAGLQKPHPHLTGDLHGTDRHAIVYEFEKLYRRFFQAGKKKRYAGNIVWKEGKDIPGEIDTVGFESQRSDSPELTEEVQPEVINRILSGEEFDAVSTYIQDIIRDIKSGDIELYQVGLPATINKPLNEYGNTQTARACRYSNEHLDGNWTQGDDPWIYFIRETPPMTPATDVLALEWDEELPDGYELEYNEIYRRALKAPLEPILGEMDWRFTELKEGAKTKSAADWSYEAPDENDENRNDSEWGW